MNAVGIARFPAFQDLSTLLPRQLAVSAREEELRTAAIS